MATPSRALLLPACPGPALPALLLLSHGIHTHWYFSKAVYRASQRFRVVAGITVVRASQYSESFESSRTAFSNFTGTQKSLKVKSTGIIPLSLGVPRAPKQCPSQTYCRLHPIASETTPAYPSRFLILSAVVTVMKECHPLPSSRSVYITGSIAHYYVYFFHGCCQGSS